MKIFFINNTKNLENIGCQMTSSGLEMLLKGHEVEHFHSESVFKINQRLIASRSLKVLTKPLSPSSKAYFLLVKDFIILKKKNVLSAIDSSELVIINGEGAIHHKRLTGIVLLAMASIAKDRGKEVHLVNATFQSLSRSQLKELRRIDRIVVREAYSRHYLLGNGIKSIQGADAAWVFLSLKFGSHMLAHQRYKESSRKNLLTLGVRANYNFLPEIFAEHKKAGDNLDYLVVDPSDLKHVEVLKDQFTLKNIIFGKDILADIDSFLRDYRLVITGRHHVAILSYFLGMPVIPLSANTYKIESTIFSIKGSTPGGEIIFTKDEVASATESAKQNFLL